MIRPPSLYDKYILTTDILDQLCNEEQTTQMNDCKKSVSYEKGENLFKEGDQPEGMIGILEGQIRLYRTIGSKKFIIRLVNPGEVLGYRSIIAGGESPVTAEALTAVKGTMVPAKSVREIIGSSPELSEKMMQLLANDSSKNEIKMASLAYKPVKSRIAETLLELHYFNESMEGKANVVIDISRENLAGLVGTVRETVTRTLVELSEEKVIDLQKRKIIIKDEQKLKKLSFEY